MNFKLAEIQPTQLYLNKLKLDKIIQQVNLNGIDSLEPIPLYELDNDIIFTDGHTRAFYYYFHKIPAKFEWESFQFDWDEYRFYRDKCKSNGITSIGDLSSRIISSELYQTLWLEFCQEVRRKYFSK